jgi:hypothetical protein
LFVSKVKFPVGGTTTVYQTSPPTKLAQPGAGGLELVAETLVPVNGFEVIVSPTINTVAVLQLSFTGGGINVLKLKGPVNKLLPLAPQSELI